MNYTVLPLLVILVGIAIMIFLVWRKFPQLAVLDVENIPEVKESKKKDEFIKKRVEKKATEAKVRRAERWQPLIARIRNVQLAFRRYVGRVERMITDRTERFKKHEPKEVRQEREADIRTILDEAQFAYDHGDIEEAEKKYIAAIRLDGKNKDAYRGLGAVYVKQGHTTEAKETYKFLLRLDPKDDDTYMRLADIAEEEGHLDEAITSLERALTIAPDFPARFAKLADLFITKEQYADALEAIKQAIDLEPQNPKYLDSLVEISILVGDKRGAEAAFQELRMVNPENQKLAALKDKIESL